jgi:HD-GYP domain-containing protein (c-di-GMP phosphodiesterase class II)
MSVSNRIWEKLGPLTASEWEQVRLHAYQSERILVRSPVLAPLAPLPGMHHERQNGSGYHRQAAGHAVPLRARVLAAADAYQAMTQARPYRPALASATAADQLTAEVSQGRLDGEAVRAVLEVAGHRTRPARAAWPGGRSGRIRARRSRVARRRPRTRRARRRRASWRTRATRRRWPWSRCSR